MAKQKKTKKIWVIMTRHTNEDGKTEVMHEKRRIESMGYKVTGASKTPYGENIMIVGEQNV